MNTFKTPLVAFGLLLFAGFPVQAQQSRYTPWQGQPQTGDMSELLKNLRSLTEQAERSKAADPTFLVDLRNLANAYDNPWPVKLLYDDFRRGNFTENPAWTVTAGTWQVENKGRFGGLHSAIDKPEAADAAPGTANGPDLISNVLGALLKQQSGQGAQENQRRNRPQRDEYASISTRVAISNPFAIRLEIASREAGGRFDFGPYLGQRSDSSYHVTYMPAAESGLVLSRVTSQGTQLLGSSNGRIGLEDGQPHVIDWKRDQAGRMTVALDGKPVIEATDTEIRRSFDGFLMVNSGGAYWIRSVAINGAK